MGVLWLNKILKLYNNSTFEERLEFLKMVDEQYKGFMPNVDIKEGKGLYALWLCYCNEVRQKHA